VSTPAEGSFVAYIGDEYTPERLTVGDRGRVVVAGTSASHVVWQDGERRGQITLTINADLLPAGHPAPIRVSAAAVRDVFDQEGERAVFVMLRDHLAAFAPWVEEAVSSVATRLSTDEHVAQSLAGLTENERADCLSHVAASLFVNVLAGGEL